MRVSCRVAGIRHLGEYPLSPGALSEKLGLEAELQCGLCPRGV